METIKISIDFNVNLSDDTKAFFTKLFSATSTTPVAPQAKSVTTVAPAAQTPAAPQAKSVAAPAAPAAPQAKSVTTVAPAAQTPAAPTPTTPAPEAPAGPNIEQVRQALAAKVNAHRQEIKDKLSLLGAPSVTKLDPAKYQEMFNFLNALA